MTHFGTHYATSATFGGRYFLQHTYSEQSMSLFTSIKLDVTMVANIQYMNKIGVNLTEEMKRYQNLTNLISSKIEVARMSIIGGQPPRSGNQIDWEKTVKEHLASVSYRPTTISLLFGFIPSFDDAAVAKSYDSFLSTYCVKHHCKDLTPERPPPKPLAISFMKLLEIQGHSKNQRTFDSNDGTIHVAMRVNKILMRSQESIDSIQFFLTDGLVEHALPVIGNRPFNHEYHVPNNDEINCIRIGIMDAGDYWKYISMQFVTEKGAQSEVYKGTYNVNQYYILCVQEADEYFVGCIMAILLTPLG